MKQQELLFIIYYPSLHTKKTCIQSTWKSALSHDTSLYTINSSTYNFFRRVAFACAATLSDQRTGTIHCGTHFVLPFLEVHTKPEQHSVSPLGHGSFRTPQAANVVVAAIVVTAAVVVAWVVAAAVLVVLVGRHSQITELVDVVVACAVVVAACVVTAVPPNDL